MKEYLTKWIRITFVGFVKTRAREWVIKNRNKQR